MKKVVMKSVFMALALTFSMAANAQSEWELPDAGPQQSPAKAESTAKDAVDAKYLEGAVPVIDGRVGWSHHLDVPGMNAQQIYDKAMAFFTALTKSENQLPGSSVALVNRSGHVFVVNLKEWMVFTNTLLSLDRTKFNCNIVVTCGDGTLDVELSRITYKYEEQRGGGQLFLAEEWITDEYSLNKKKTKLYRNSGKFRRKTIDRKDEIFNDLDHYIVN